MPANRPSTEVRSVQREMPFFTRTEKPSPVAEHVLQGCTTLLEAIQTCVQVSRYTKHYTLAEDLGIDRGHWTRIMQGSAHFPTNKLQRLMELCGNLAPLQFMAKAMAVPLVVDDREIRKAALRRELELLEQGPSIVGNGVTHQQLAA